jgi:hypothetical protein
VRRAIVSVAAAAGVVALIVVAAPALSARPYQPEPVEFMIPAPPHGLGTSTARGFVSREIAAPKRFNVVGFEWDGGTEPAIAVRVRGEGEDWGRWTTVPARPDGAPDPGSGEGRGLGVSAPVWAGQADYVQYRMSNRPPGLRLHFINTTGTATALDRAETGVRGALDDGLTALASLTSPASGESNGPEMISRAAWGAEACPPRREPRIERVKVAFVHHTVTANRYSRAQAKAMVLGICTYHRDVNGWDDIGYNFLVDRFGRIFVGRAGGRDQAVMGAHAEGFNDQSTGVASLGTYGTKRLSRDGVRALARLIRWKLRHHGQPIEGTARTVSGGGASNRYPEGAIVRLRRISGHRDVSPTRCPGDRLYRQLREVRERAAR